MERTRIRSYEELIGQAVALAREDRPKRVAVAAAQDADVIGAVCESHSDGFVDAVLAGDEARICKLAEESGHNLSGLSIIDEPDVTKAAHAAVALAAERKADIIMKGFLPTSAILKTVLDKKYGLRGPNTLSHCAVLDIPGYGKLLNYTDGGMVVRPNADQKIEIIENAVLVGRALGIEPVKVAVSVVNHERLLDDATRRIEAMTISGPLSFEAALSPRAAELLGRTGPVAGDADVFVVDSIEECNVVAKSLINFAGAVFAGVIVGARVPVSIVSRTDTVKNKKASLALACLIADFYTRNRIWEN
jgi:phosphotransacetylase